MGRDVLLSARARAKLVDWALGLSAIGFALRLVLQAGRNDRSLPMVLSLALLDTVVGVLFIRRAPASVGATPRRPLLVALLTVFAAAAALRLVGRSPAPWAEALFVLGALGTAASLASLGRSFGVLPARRAIVTRGPYRLVRHPAYACELCMLVAVLGAGGPGAWALGSLVAGLQVARLLGEERLLATDPAYRRYMARVRHRLVPFVF